MQKLFDYCKQNRIAVVLALSASLLTIISNLSGVGWSWDSSDYVAVAKNFADDLSLIDATGLPMTVRPPGLSILIAFGDWLGLGINLTVQILNAICAAVVVFGTNYLLKVAKVKQTIAVLATAFVAFSPALLWQYSMIWSEPPFIAILLTAVIVSLRPIGYLKFGALTALFVSLFFIRYVGPVFSVAIATASAFFDRRQIGAIKSALINFATLAISFVPVWFWLARNKNIDSTLTGARTPGGGSILVPLKTFTSTIGSWLVAGPVEGGIYLSWDTYPSNTKVLGVFTIAIFFGLIVSYLFISLKTNHISENLSVFVVNAFIGLLYVGFSAYRFVHWELGPLDNRMMIPVFVPMVLIVAVSLDKIKINQKIVRTSFCIFFALFVTFQGASSFRDAVNFGKYGRYWAAHDFLNQPMHKFVVSLPSNSLLMSNQPQQLFAVWQKSSIHNQYQLDLAHQAKCDQRYFVWYNSTYDDGTLNLEGQPEGAEVLFNDTSGSVHSLGSCASDLATYWP